MRDNNRFLLPGTPLPNDGKQRRKELLRGRGGGQTKTLKKEEKTRLEGDKYENSEEPS